ncbi:MAG: hypothetical protein JNL85_15685 [Rubrivivax sp.]|nr:hypothetical protein [Rubrivivax sp.]
MFFKRIVLPLVVLAAVAFVYFWAALKWSYATGERAGWVQKLSKKGWVCKTWEGELALVSLPGSTAEKFLFTVRDDETAQRIMRHIGKRVSLHYEEKVGLPTSCFGETRHFVTGVALAEEIPIGPGIVVPTPPGGATGTPPAATPAVPAAPVAPAAPVSR